MIDLPPESPPIAACIQAASTHYGADAKKIHALLAKRAGISGDIRILPTGKVEIGLLRIPGEELPPLAKHGIDAKKLADDDCLNIAIGTYLHQRELLGASNAAQAAVSSSHQTVTSRSKGERETIWQHQCVATAAHRYHLPTPLFQAVLKTEGGWTGLKKVNTNGSYDMGPGQINTIHLPELSKFGITEHQLINDSCVNFHVAAYRLRFEINRVGDLWRGIGNYHSRTPHLNQAYQSRVRKNLASVQAAR